MSRAPLARDVESRELMGIDVEEVKGKERWDEALFRSLFSVLRREGEKEELKRRVEDVEGRLEGWRDGQEEGCAENVKRGELGCGISVDVGTKYLFSRFGGA